MEKEQFGLGHRAFRLEVTFTSIEEFARFCTVIRGDVIDAAQASAIAKTVTERAQSVTAASEKLGDVAKAIDDIAPDAGA